jgi:hypothetical protein
MLWEVNSLSLRARFEMPLNDLLPLNIEDVGVVGYLLPNLVADLGSKSGSKPLVEDHSSTELSYRK